MLGITPCSSTTVSALSRSTSAVNITTGGRDPIAKPARRARSTSLPLTASIHSPPAHPLLAAAPTDPQPRRAHRLQHLAVGVCLHRVARLQGVAGGQRRHLGEP